MVWGMHCGGAGGQGGWVVGEAHDVTGLAKTLQLFLYFISNLFNIILVMSV